MPPVWRLCTFRSGLGRPCPRRPSVRTPRALQWSSHTRPPITAVFLFGSAFLVLFQEEKFECAGRKPLVSLTVSRP